MSPPRPGLLIIRAWIEPHPTAPFRATVRQTTNLEVGLLGSVNLSSKESVVAVVRDWFRDVEEAAVITVEEPDPHPADAETDIPG